MAQIRECGAVLLNVIYSVTWLFIKEVSAAETAAPPYLDIGPEVLESAGERRVGDSPAGNVNVSVESATQVQPHPGIIVAVVIVALLAILSGFCIVRKYCFPQSNQTYRYSTLRRYEELDISEENTPCRQHLDSNDSDEDLLE